MNARDKDDSVTLAILEAVDESSDVTQRHLARRLGVALGLANSLMRRCVRKGLIKVQQAPANRYIYYLTPQGFAEKSRLTADYLRYSLSFYRRASDSVAALFAACAQAGKTRVVLCGVSDLAEIAALRASSCGVQVVAVYDPLAEAGRWAGQPVSRVLPPAELWDLCVVTDLGAAQATWSALVAALDVERVRVPDVLGVDRRVARATIEEGVL